MVHDAHVDDAIGSTSPIFVAAQRFGLFDVRGAGWCCFWYSRLLELGGLIIKSYFKLKPLHKTALAGFF
jgi:hypothetical protein